MDLKNVFVARESKHKKEKKSKSKLKTRLQSQGMEEERREEKEDNSFAEGDSFGEQQRGAEVV